MLRTTERVKAHDETNRCIIGDEVKIVEWRPISKEKRWRIAETLVRGNVAEIAPREIGVPEEAMPERQAPPAPVAAAPAAEVTDSQSEPKEEIIDTVVEAAEDEAPMHTESDVLQGAADDMDPTDYGKPEAEEKE
jgi:hypothetical protein